MYRNFVKEKKVTLMPAITLCAMKDTGKLEIMTISYLLFPYKTMNKPAVIRLHTRGQRVKIIKPSQINESLGVLSDNDILSWLV